MDGWLDGWRRRKRLKMRRRKKRNEDEGIRTSQRKAYPKS